MSDKSSARVKAGKKAWASLSQAEKDRRLAALAKGRAKAGKGGSKKAKKSGSRKPGRKAPSAPATRASARKGTAKRGPGRPKGQRDTKPRKPRSDKGKKRGSRKASPKRKKARTGPRGGKIIAPHKGNARCEHCGEYHDLREHWSHAHGGHSGRASHSFEKARGTAAPKKRKASAPKRRKKAMRTHAPGGNAILYRKDAHGNWVPTKRGAAFDPMALQMQRDKHARHHASPPPKRGSGKLNSIEAVKAELIRQRVLGKKKR